MPEKGVQFRRMGRKNEMRSVYQQSNGDYILADDCKCQVNFSGRKNSAGETMPFTVVRAPNCPIDEHRATKSAS